MEIPLDEAREGDVLAADVKHGGAMLLQAGSELTAQRIEALRARGVKSVVIARRGAARVGKGEFEAAVAELDHMFSDVRGDPIMDGIHAVARAMLEKARPRA